jgi:hypothetical protein
MTKINGKQKYLCLPLKFKAWDLSNHFWTASNHFSEEYLSALMLES